MDSRNSTDFASVTAADSARRMRSVDPASAAMITVGSAVAELAEAVDDVAAVEGEYRSWTQRTLAVRHPPELTCRCN
jgi:hypothetical protein